MSVCQTLVTYPRETVRVHAAELYGVVAAAIQEDQQFSESLRQMHQLATSKVGRCDSGPLRCYSAAAASVVLCDGNSEHEML